MRKILLIFYCFTSIVFSQETTSLKQVLNRLEKTYNIAFSYNENIIQNYKQVTFSNEDNLESVLLQLSINTKLVYEKIDDKNYIIRHQTDKKKNICGVVFNQKNNDILPFANVYYSGKNILANKDGKFEVSNISIDDILTITSIGYQPKHIAVKDFYTDCKRVYLTEQVYELSQIVITDYLTSGFSKKNDGSIVLDAKKTGILPGVIEPDVLQSLQLIPGVQSPNETTSGIHIRGSTPDQNLVIFDGMKMYHFSHYFGLISAFNPYITNDIKLYRSGTRAKYGNSVGGVLDISTNNNTPNKFSAGFGTTLTHADFYIKAPLFHQKVGIVASARRSFTDFINTYTNQQYAKVAFQNSKISEGLDAENLKISNAEYLFFYEDYHSKIIVEPNSNNKLSFSYLYNLNNLSFTGDNVAARLTNKDDVVIKNEGFHFDWEHGDLSKGTHKIAMSHTGFIKDYDGTRTRSIKNNTQEDTYYDKYNSVKENNVSYLFSKQTKNLNQWEFGYQFNYNSLAYKFGRITTQTSDFVDDSIESRASNSALFSEYQFHLKNKWFINLGLRWQYFKGIEKNYLEPRFNVNYQTNKYLNFKFSTELKHQSIAQVIDFRNDGLGGLFDRFWALSNNRELPVLKSFQTSIGTDYQKNKWTLDIELYYKNIDGVLFLFDEMLIGQKYFSGNNYIKGLDLLIKKDWNNYNTWVSYTWSKSLYQFNDLDNGENFDGSYDIPHHFIWSHNYSIQKKLEFSLGWRFRSGLPYTVKTAEKNSDDRLKIKFSDLNTERLPNYTRLDFSTRYKFYLNRDKNIKGQLGLTIQNIFNQKNILSRDYEIQTLITGLGNDREEKDVLVETDKLSIGFVPNLCFRVNF